MGCRILVGREQGRDHEIACFFCSVSGSAFGPVFWRGEEEAETFMRWLEKHPSMGALPGLPVTATSDPRAYPEDELIALYGKFRDEAAKAVSQ